MDAKTAAAQGWVEQAAEAADPVGEHRRKTVAFVMSRIKRAAGLEPDALPGALDGLSVDALYEHRKALWRERDLLSARLHDVDEAICREQRDDESAVWHGLAALALRTQDPKDEAAADEAWLHSMAVSYLRRGAVPEPGSHRAADIVAAMARIVPDESVAAGPAEEVGP